MPHVFQISSPISRSRGLYFHPPQIMSCFETVESVDKLQKDTNVEECGFLDRSKRDQRFEGQGQK